MKWCRSNVTIILINLQTLYTKVYWLSFTQNFCIYEDFLLISSNLRLYNMYNR